MKSRRCLWPGCQVLVPPRMWGCRKHWYRLPQAIRDAIWASYHPGQETRLGIISREYVRAVEAAEEWVLANHPPSAEAVKKPTQRGLF